jgi:predicted RNA binding protein YcfA (HicA-like mRNA interferase family)
VKLPRDLDGTELIRRLRPLGYTPVRQSGSHVRLTRTSGDEVHHITIPLHTPLKIGTLNSILTDIAVHLRLTRDELLKRLQ